MVYKARSVKRVRWTNAQLARLDEAIVAAVEADSPVSLRGVFYRAVSAGAVDKTLAGYNRVMRQLQKLRQDHRVRYRDITDGTGWVTRPTTWSDPDRALANLAASYRRALWDAQAHEVHIFTEKDAISGVVYPKTSEWDVPVGVVRGYRSDTFAYEMAEAIDYGTRRGKIVHVYQLGDHDSSGVDAWRDFQQKVGRFIAVEFGGDPDEVEFERLAVTEDQIREWSLPTRPTKRTDKRAGRFAGESVEVDAIPANTLRELVGQAIEQHIDPWQLRLTREQRIWPG